MDEVEVIHLQDSRFKLQVFHSQELLRLTETRERTGVRRTGESYDHILCETTLAVRRGMHIQCVQYRCCDDCGAKMEIRVDGETVMRWPAGIHP